MKRHDSKRVRAIGKARLDGGRVAAQFSSASLFMYSCVMPELHEVEFAYLLLYQEIK